MVSIEWQEISELPVGMCRIKATWLNGRLYFGGGCSPYGSVSEKYEAMLFCCSPPYNEYTTIPTPVSCYGLATYCSHVVLVGGYKYPGGKITNKVWTLEDETKFRDDFIVPMTGKRCGVTAVSFKEHLLVAGGEDGIGGPCGLNTVELYNVNWNRVTNLPKPSKFMYSTVFDGNVYFMGGTGYQDKEVWFASIDELTSTTPSSSLWQRLEDVPCEWSCTITPTSHDLLFSIGGIKASVTGRWPVPHSSAMYVFSPCKKTCWQHIGELPTKLSATCTTITPNGEFILIGGYTDTWWSKRVFKGYPNGNVKCITISAKQSQFKHGTESISQITSENNPPRKSWLEKFLCAIVCCKKERSSRSESDSDQTELLENASDSHDIIL